MPAVLRRLLWSIGGWVALAAAPATSQAAIRLSPVGNFNAPTSVTAAPGDVHRLYVVERDGTIRVVRDGTVLPTPFVNLSGEVSTDGERGLLSMAFSPDFQSSRLFYVYFTDLSGNVRVDQLRAPSGDQGDSPATYRHPVISVPHPASNHDGGTVQFGPDGYLYMAPGDGATSSNAQSLSTPLGKVLRVHPRPGADGFDIPTGNPFRSSPIWSYGLRNPFRFSFDRATGDLHRRRGRAHHRGGRLRTAIIGRREGGHLRLADLRGELFDREHHRSVHVLRQPPAGDRPVPLERLDRADRRLWSRAILHSPRCAAATSTPTRPRRHLVPCAPAPACARQPPDGTPRDRAGGLWGGQLWPPLRDLLAGRVYRLVEDASPRPCGPGSSGSGPGSSGGRDVTAPRLVVRIPRRQRVLRARGVVAYARCSERCTVSMSARLRIGRRSYRLHPDDPDERRPPSEEAACGAHRPCAACAAPRRHEPPGARGSQWPSGRETPPATARGWSGER